MDNLKIGDFAEYKFLSQLKFSQDGRKVGFTVKETVLEENKYHSFLWIYDLEQDNYFKLTNGKKAGQYLWLDDENIIFVSGRDQKNSEQEEEAGAKTRLYKINIKGGEAEYFAELPFTITDMKKGDGEVLYLTGMTDLNQPEEEGDGGTRQEEEDYQVLEEIPFWSNGKGYTNQKRNHLFSFNLKKKQTEELVSGKFNVIDFDLRGDQLVLNMEEFVDRAELSSDLYRYQLEDKQLTRLTNGELIIDFVNFKDDKQVQFAATDMKSTGINTNYDIYEINLDDLSVIRITDMDKSLWTSVGSDSRLGGGYHQRLVGDKLYFLTTEDYNTYLNVLEGGEVTRVIDREGAVDMFDINQGKIVYIAFRGNRLQELYLVDNGEERRLTDFNGSIIEEKKISKPEHFTVTTSDGCQLDAWVIKPTDFDSAEKYPAVLEIHGGPKTVYGTIFFHEMQVLANQGYVIVFTNPRGSDGRGNSFSDIRGKYGTIDYQDLMETLDQALDKFDFIDRERLGVAGGSYGGYMTNWIIGHTDRFKAAVSQRSISNWISKFATTDIGYFFVKDQAAGATPWNGFEQLWESSPLKYADRVTTPTLFIHGEEDYRCWLPEGIQMFTALKYHGVESRMVIFKGENHELSRSGLPKHRIRRLEEMVNWFNKYLKN